MLPSEEIRLLHRHGDAWQEMRPAHHAPSDHDVERRLVSGGRVFLCAGCETKFRVEPLSDEEEAGP